MDLMEAHRELLSIADELVDIHNGGSQREQIEEDDLVGRLQAIASDLQDYVRHGE